VARWNDPLALPHSMERLPMADSRLKFHRDSAAAMLISETRFRDRCSLSMQKLIIIQLKYDSPLHHLSPHDELIREGQRTDVVTHFHIRADVVTSAGRISGRSTGLSSNLSSLRSKSATSPLSPLLCHLPLAAVAGRREAPEHLNDIMTFCRVSLLGCSTPPQCWPSK
jgi:hypothetical protein